jgi:hypothetical protein
MYSVFVNPDESDKELDEVSFPVVQRIRKRLSSKLLNLDDANLSEILYWLDEEAGLSSRLVCHTLRGAIQRLAPHVFFLNGPRTLTFQYFTNAVIRETFLAILKNNSSPEVAILNVMKSVLKDNVDIPPLLLNRIVSRGPFALIGLNKELYRVCMVQNSTFVREWMVQTAVK